MKKIKAVILCGGQGTRIRDVSEILPKPMLTIGKMPILWHIMKIYAHYGIKDFVLCLGYKSWIIKDFFLNYQAKVGDILLTLGNHNPIEFYNAESESGWKITLVETGDYAQTGARIWNARKYLEDCDAFCVTYGDGVADINIPSLLETHKKSGLLGTITGVRPAGRFGEMEINGNTITEFNEKPNVSAGLINGGFMVLDKSVINKYFKDGNDLILERDVLPYMVKDRQLAVHQHNGFWQCVDTIREYNYLNELWNQNNAPWKKWQ